MSDIHIPDRRPAALASQRAELLTEAQGLATRDIDGPEFERFQAIEAAIGRIDNLTEILEASEDPQRVTPGTGPVIEAFNVNVRDKDPHAFTRDNRALPVADLRSAALDAVGNIDGVTDERAELIGGVLRTEGESASRFQLAKSDPAYMSGFMKRVLHPDLPSLLTTDEARAVAAMEAAAMSERAALGVSATFVPTQIDPSIIISNAGVGPDSIRSISRNVVSNRTTWSGITSAGVTSSMDAEFAEVSDDTPTLTALDIPLEKAQALVQFSHEAEQDADALVSELSRVLWDAKHVLEEGQFGTGTGSTPQTQGIIDQLDGGASEDTTPATAEVFAIADLYNLFGDLPSRHVGNASWLIHHGTGLEIIELASALTSAQGLWSDIGAGHPPLLLGAPVTYHDGAANARSIDATATAVNTGVATVGDFGEFVIADHAHGAAIELVPHIFATANNLPAGTRALYLTWRFGSKATHIDAFRMLSVPTTA
jgi:HK97 family phage major capsid protein